MMLARFRAGASSGAIRWLGWTCALAPGAVSDLDAVIRLLESAREEDSGDSMTALSLGALHFRAGQSETAVAFLTEVADAVGASTITGRLARLYLALAEGARGRFDEARAAFDSAVEARLGESYWSLRLSVSLLEDEAGAAVLGRGFGTPEERLARF